MVHDSDPNAEKHALYMLKVGGQTLLFDPPLEKVGGQLTPLTPCFRGLCETRPRLSTFKTETRRDVRKKRLETETFKTETTSLTFTNVYWHLNI